MVLFSVILSALTTSNFPIFDIVENREVWGS